MSSKANPAAVGLFVVGATALAVAGVLAFGGGDLFKQKLEYVMFFGGAVEGLRVGSPVTFRGVKVGAVSSVHVTVSDDGGDIRIPVYVELDPSSFTRPGEAAGEAYARAIVHRLVQRGLRGQLRVQSLITGQLSIMLDFHPDDEPRYVGGQQDVPELPTIPSSLEQLTRSIEKMPFEEILNRILNIAEGIEALVGDPALRGGVTTLNASLEELRDLIATLNTHVGPLADQLQRNADSLDRLLTNVDRQVGPVATGLRETAAETELLVSNLNERVDALVPALQRAADAATAALGEAEAVLDRENGPVVSTLAEFSQATARASDALSEIEHAAAAIREGTGEGSALRYEATRALTEISAAARSLRSMAEFLERHPEAILRGRGADGEP